MANVEDIGARIVTRFHAAYRGYGRYQSRIERDIPLVTCEP